MASKYFLVIDGLNGGSVDAQHVGWFDISSFDIDLSNALAAGGNAAGATKFGPLLVDLSLDPALAGALRDIASGQSIPSIKIEGVTTNGQAVYDLTLADVTLTQLHEGNGGNTDR